MHKLRWDDLQILLAVAEQGSASAAALALGVNHSTILRRVSAFEDEQGVKLFERRSSGYTPTPAGRDLFQAARRMAETVFDIEREILGQDRKLSGNIVLTTTDSIVLSLLGPYLASFQASHPEITVNLAMTNTRLDLARLDADIGVRPSRNPPDTLLGRRVGGLAFAVYGRRASDRTAPFELAGDHNWLGGCNALLNAPPMQWMADTLTAARIVARADSFVALRTMAEAGIGLALLPCCLGDQSPTLERLTAPLAEVETSIWVLTHRDLRNTARVRALSDHLTSCFRRERDRLEGRAPGEQ